MLGRAVRELLEKQFPGNAPRGTDEVIGQKVMKAAWDGGAKTVQDQADAVMGTLDYLVRSGHDFGKHTDSVDSAMNFFLNAVRRRAISDSKSRKTRGKRQEVLDYESDEEPEGYADGSLALDDATAIKRFVEEFADELPHLLQTLSEDEKALFDIIFEYEIGGFSQGIDENMGQGSALREVYPKIYEKNKKRWSGFVYDLRKKLLKKIEDYVLSDSQLRDEMRDLQSS